MKKTRKRGPSLEDKYLGTEPNYHGQELNDEEFKNACRQSANYFNYFHNTKSNVPIVLLYAEKELGYSKKDVQALKKVENWKLNQGIGNNIRCFNAGLSLERLGIADNVRDRLSKLLEEGKKIVKEIQNEPIKVVISPAERMQKKVMETIYYDFDTIVVDSWMDNNFDNIKFPAYGLLTAHGIKGGGINIFRKKMEFELELIMDAYNKTCEQAVEAYEHITKGNKKKMITLLEKIIADVDRLKLNNKSARLPRAKKPKSSDSQVSKLQFKENDVENKLTSINPIMIPSKERLFVYNTKTRKLTEYLTTSTKGFEVGGTSIKNFCDKSSRTAKLRKPEDILPHVLTLAPTKINKKVWDNITTKVTVPNGRINKDCILLRVL